MWPMFSCANKNVLFPRPPLIYSFDFKSNLSPILSSILSLIYSYIFSPMPLNLFRRGFFVSYIRVFITPMLYKTLTVFVLMREDMNFAWKLLKRLVIQVLNFTTFSLCLARACMGVRYAITIVLPYLSAAMKDIKKALFRQCATIIRFLVSFVHFWTFDLTELLIFLISKFLD